MKLAEKLLSNFDEAAWKVFNYKGRAGNISKGKDGKYVAVIGKKDDEAEVRIEGCDSESDAKKKVIALLDGKITNESLSDSRGFESSQVDYFVDKAFMKGMASLSEPELKAWLKVPELSKKEQELAFKKIKSKINKKG